MLYNIYTAHVVKAVCLYSVKAQYWNHLHFDSTQSMLCISYVHKTKKIELKCKYTPWAVLWPACVDSWPDTQWLDNWKMWLKHLMCRQAITAQLWNITLEHNIYQMYHKIIIYWMKTKQKINHILYILRQHILNVVSHSAEELRIVEKTAWATQLAE